MWPPEFCPQTPTEPPEATRNGTKFYGPCDNGPATLKNLGDRTDQPNINGVLIGHVVSVRKQFMAACDLNDAGYDVHLLANWPACQDGRSFELRVRRADLDAVVLFPGLGSGA